VEKVLQWTSTSLGQRIIGRRKPLWPLPLAPLLGPPTAASESLTAIAQTFETLRKLIIDVLKPEVRRGLPAKQGTAASVM
jgi:hypothetical protein